MLNKSICSKCYERHNIPWEDIYSGVYPDELWEKGKVRCPIPEKVWDRRPDNVPIFISRFSNKKVPDHCEYSLEHVIAE